MNYIIPCQHVLYTAACRLVPAAAHPCAPPPPATLPHRLPLPDAACLPACLHRHLPPRIATACLLPLVWTANNSNNSNNLPARNIPACQVLHTLRITQLPCHRLPPPLGSACQVMCHLPACLPGYYTFSYTYRSCLWSATLEFYLSIYLLLCLLTYNSLACCHYIYVYIYILLPGILLPALGFLLYPACLLLCLPAT